MAGLSNLRYEQVPYEGYLSEGTPWTMPRATASMPPREMTLEEYLGLMNPQRRATLPEAPPQGLQAAPPASADPSPEQYYRGRGSEGEMAYTNIPEVAEQRGLRKFDLAPPVASVGGVEMYGSEAPTGAIAPWERKTPLEYAQMTGAFRSPAPTSQANLMPRTAEEAQAEAQRMITVGRQKGYADNDILADIRERGLDKMLAAKETRIPYKIGDKEYWVSPKEYADMPGVKEKEEKAPGTIETAEGVFQWNPESKRFDIPLGKGKGTLKEIKEIAKEEKAAKKEEARLQMAMTKANLVMGKVDEALKQVGYGTAGFGGAVLGKVPGTPAVDLDETLDTIRANIGFNELSEMRQASPTGGALGQVAVRELELLTSALGSLNRRQGPAQLTKNLESIKSHYANWKTAVDEAAQPPAAETGGGKTVTVRNPTTGEMETWDLTTEQRVQ